jgi:DNA-binding PadR family transcriptional regulator
LLVKDVIELLILVILLDDKSSIYGIKQKIERQFSSFFKVSFGSLYPALKKLNKNNFVAVKTDLSQGGQKRSLYSLTDRGREYFNDLMLESLPDNPNTANQLINIKILALSRVEPDKQKAVIKLILAYLEFQKIRFENILNNQENSINKFQEKFVKRNLIKVTEDIQWLNSLIS